MAVEAFLGNPPENIKAWIQAHSQPAGHSDTRVTYTTESGLPDWSGEIEGELKGAINIPNWGQIKRLDIGNTVTRIQEYSFESQSTITDVIIPNSVSSIGFSAFYECTQLTSVIFTGRTLEQVQAMENYGANWGIVDTSIISVA